MDDHGSWCWCCVGVGVDVGVDVGVEVGFGVGVGVGIGVPPKEYLAKATHKALGCSQSHVCVCVVGEGESQSSLWTVKVLLHYTEPNSVLALALALGVGGCQ